MKQDIVLKHEFVEFIPGEIKPGMVYLSMRFGTAVHLCACGCRSKVVTPLRPTDWKLIFDGKTISLDPSIGNWSFECKSHYWIRNNKVQWAAPWSKSEIDAGRAYDGVARERYLAPDISAAKVGASRPGTRNAGWRPWRRFRSWWSSRSE